MAENPGFLPDVKPTRQAWMLACAALLQGDAEQFAQAFYSLHV